MCFYVFSLENIGGYILIYMNYLNIYIYYVHCSSITVRNHLFQNILCFPQLLHAKFWFLLVLSICTLLWICLFACFFIFIFCGRVLCSPRCTPTCYIARVCFELLILVSSSLAGLTCVLYHTQFYVLMGIELYQLNYIPCFPFTCSYDGAF